jgi:hypothetical protein
MKPHALLALALLLAAFPAPAATITPAAPTAQDVITAAITVANTATFGRPVTTVTGNTIRTDLPLISSFGGPIPFPVQLFERFGPLQPGTYTYQVYDIENGQAFLLSQQTIVVAPAIPAMNRLYLAILAMCLAAIGWFTVAR